MSHYRNERVLNAEQKKAVYHEEGPILVLAGAGSGKTRVITYRIVNLINERGISPANICAVTFTNKAAGEMKERLRAMLERPLRGMFIGTYHALGLKILRENTEKLPLSGNFSIQAQDDQLAIISEIQTEMKIDPDEIPEKMMLSIFSKARNSGLKEVDLPAALDEQVGYPFGDAIERYLTYLRNTNSVDFDDLILMPRDLLLKDEAVREKYRRKFRFFLADEFQDTNPLQFDFLKLLMAEPYNLCAVGDDDQSIYGWRGADIRIILDFKNTFKGAEEVYLEQNYRSTQVILDMANHTIANNPDRHPKKLWSAVKEGSIGTVMTGTDPDDEADQITDTIMYLNKVKGKSLNDMALLFRTNFQSRPFEEMFRHKNIPYHLTGGYQFYDRKEVRDVIAYLRFFANHHDEKSLIRILNFPKRNIGDSSIKRLKSYALAEGIALWEVIENIETCPVKLQAATLSGILEFRDMIGQISPELHRPGNLGKGLLHLLEVLNLEEEFYRAGLDDNKVQAKLLNLKELTGSVYSFEDKDRSIPMLPDNAERNLFEYLQYISLLTGDQNEKDDTEKVRLMTFHLAKGLEFPVVFLTGLADGILPHKRSIQAKEEGLEENGHSIEEERRLFYVGITRAQRKLYFSYPQISRSYGEEIENQPSRFLSEIPSDLIKWQSEDEVDSEAGIDDLFNMLKAI